MGCGMGMIKYLLFIFNFIFAVCGLAILAIGVIVHLQLSGIADNMKENLMFPSITLIVIGSIIFVVSFFGCCGAIRESHCMTVTFATFLLFILLVQVAIAVYAFVVIRNDVDKEINITEDYNKLFKNYWSNPETRGIIDTIQSGLKCCGVNSANDFINTQNGTIPWSCCGKPETEFCLASSSYDVGCVNAIKNFLKYAGTVLGGVAIGIAGVELIGIIFALCLANSIRNSERRGYRV